MCKAPDCASGQTSSCPRKGASQRGPRDAPRVRYAGARDPDRFGGRIGLLSGQPALLDCAVGRVAGGPDRPRSRHSAVPVDRDEPVAVLGETRDSGRGPAWERHDTLSVEWLLGLLTVPVAHAESPGPERIVKHADLRADRDTRTLEFTLRRDARARAQPRQRRRLEPVSVATGLVGGGGRGEE